jgi:hypothetical protein
MGLDLLIYGRLLHESIRSKRWLISMAGWLGNEEEQHDGFELLMGARTLLSQS